MNLYRDYHTPQTLDFDAQAIQNAIKNILSTDKGSLPGKPTFGSRLRHVLFEQMDDITEELARRVISEAIYEWEDRIIIKKIDIISEQAYNRYIINISYVFKDSGLNNTASVSLDMF